MPYYIVCFTKLKQTKFSGIKVPDILNLPEYYLQQFPRIVGPKHVILWLNTSLIWCRCIWPVCVLDVVPARRAGRPVSGCAAGGGVRPAAAAAA